MGNISVVQNTSAPTGNVPAAQNTNAPARNVSAVQNTGAPTKATTEDVVAAQPANALAPRSDRLPDVREPSVSDLSSKPARDSPGFPIDERSLVAEPRNGSLRYATELRWVMRVARSWLARLVSSRSIRFLTFFCIGVAFTLAWQSYRDAGTEAITSWCGRWAPQAASPAQNLSSHSEDLVPVSPDLLKTTSLNLAAVRESIDKMATELSRLQTNEKLAAELTRLQVERATPDRTFAPSPLVPPIPPAGKPPSPSRPSPVH